MIWRVLKLPNGSPESTTRRTTWRGTIVAEGKGDAIVHVPVRYYVPTNDGSPLGGMLGEDYEVLPTNLSELPEWREYVRETARRDVKREQESE